MTLSQLRLNAQYYSRAKDEECLKLRVRSTWLCTVLLMSTGPGHYCTMTHIEKYLPKMFLIGADPIRKSFLNEILSLLYHFMLKQKITVNFNIKL